MGQEGYEPIQGTSGLWKHNARDIMFALCVDNFGVKYFKKYDVDHLLNALQKYYEISIDWQGKDYCGLSLDWNYSAGYVDI